MLPPRLPRTFGYARVSTAEQELRLQLDALIVAGVAQVDIFVDQGSGAAAARPGLDALLATVAKGVTIVAWRLDRLGRSVLNLADLLEGLRTRGVPIGSITDGVDTSSSMGRLEFDRR